MGEAKRREAVLRQQLLDALDSWSFPATQWEADTVTALEGLPIVIVERVAPSDLAYMRMPKAKCHANCQWYEANDPSGNFKAVTGWLVDPDGNYVLHSVVSDGTQYSCITPPIADNRAYFDFIPDSNITWIENKNGMLRATIYGHMIGPGVRKNPAKTISEADIMNKKLLSGTHPMKVAQR